MASGLLSSSAVSLSDRLRRTRRRSLPTDHHTDLGPSSHPGHTRRKLTLNFWSRGISQLSFGLRFSIPVQVSKDRVKVVSQSTLASLKFFNMTASSVSASGAAAVDPRASKEVASISTPTMDLVGEEARSIDPSAEKRVLRKIDLFLMPAMVIGELAKIIFNTTLQVTNTNMQAMVWSTTTRPFWEAQHSSV